MGDQQRTHDANAKYSSASAPTRMNMATLQQSNAVLSNRAAANPESNQPMMLLSRQPPDSQRPKSPEVGSVSERSAQAMTPTVSSLKAPMSRAELRLNCPAHKQPKKFVKFLSRSRWTVNS